MIGRVLIDGRELAVSKHAVERYGERVKDWLTPAQAREDLLRVLALAGRRVERPSWALAVAETEFWIEVGDGIAFPVLNGNLMTCVTRGSPSEETREAITELQQGRRERKNAPGRREKHGKVRRAGREARRRQREAFDG